MNEELLLLWPRAERILDEVLDLPEAERRARVAAACAGDGALERAVTALLRSDGEDDDFLAVPPAGPPEATEDDGAEPRPASLPARVGPFRTVRELGRGGMGAVLLAVRDDGQFDQSVAIKLLDEASHSPTARESLLRERNILGRLEHAHIARIFDGGVTDGGVPYFVMEHVDGKPIDEHCDAGRLGIEARLALFLQVCQAVEYAHGRLIVHRDLKPGNILVNEQGQAKLLDFGIARVMEEGEGAQTVSRVLTPVYAAPEQLRGEPVTVATDVYQLGLVLFELLTGRRAHGEDTGSLLALQRRVMEADPDRPSRAVLQPVTRQRSGRTVTLSPAEIGHRRGLGENALSRELDGDLDAIVLKALRKEPSERYATVEALRRDVESFLSNRPVAARRGSAAYRVRKFARRNRTWLSAAALVVLSSAAGIVAVAAQSRLVASERDRARHAEARAAAINDFLVNELLQAASPEKALGRRLTIADVLDKAAQSVGHAFRAQPETEAEVRLTLARTYASMGGPAEARRHAEAAHRLLSARHGEQGAETLRAARMLAELAIDEGRYAEARRQLEELRRGHEAVLGPEHPETLETAAALGRALHGLGEWAAAETLLRETAAAAEARHPDLWRLTAKARRLLVDPLVAQDKAVEAEALARSLLHLQRAQLGPDHPEVLDTLHLIAKSVYRQLRIPESVSAFKEVITLSERVYGPDHPATAEALLGLARAYDNGLNLYDESLAIGERALDIYRKALGPEHPQTLRALERVGVTNSHAARISVAEPIFRRILEVRRRTLGETHPDTLRALRYQSELLAKASRFHDARQLVAETVRAYEEALTTPEPDAVLMHEYAKFLTTVEPEDVRDPSRALAVAERAVGLTRRKDFYCLFELGRAQGLTGRPDLAISTLREALTLPEAVRSWTTEELLADLLRRHASPEELERFLLWRLERLRALRGEAEPFTARTLRLLALHYERLGRGAEAEGRFAEALAQLRKTRREDDWQVGRAKSELGGRLAARGAYAEAEPLLVEGHSTLTADVAVRKVYLDESRERLMKLYEAWGRPAEAARWRARP